MNWYRRLRARREAKKAEWAQVMDGVRVVGWGPFRLPGELKRRQESRAYAEEVVAARRNHRADRGDEVAAWLKRWRDNYEPSSGDYLLLDAVLDDYRLHADTGTPLDQHACEGSHCCD